METEAAKDKKQHLLDVWFDRIEAENKFCVKTTVNAQDEWLHSFYYFNDEIPTDADFEKTVGDYLSFEFSMIMQGRRYLFENVDSENDSNKNDGVKKNFKLSDREWKEFRIGDLFGKSINSKPYHLNNLREAKEGIPYITRTSLNNGLQCIIEKGNYKINPKNSISFGAENAEYFYQPSSYISGNKMYYYHRENTSEKSLKFITQCLNKGIQNCGFGYGMGLTGTRSDIRKILLPVLENGEPDFDFMENYIQKVEQEKLSEYKTYAQKQLSELSYQEIEPLENKEWKDFYIRDLFNKFVQGKSKGLNHLSEKNGIIPYLGATNRNNGVLTFVEKSEKIEQEGNCICFIRNGQGSVGYSVYKSEKFISTSDNTFAYSDWLNKYTGHFIVTVSDMIRSKYSFGYKRNNEQLLKDRLMLPITPDGSPDYVYMEQYTKNLMYKKYTEYLEYKT